MSYLILCKDRCQGMALWWRADRMGYTTDVAVAGRYSREEAESIARIRGIDVPVDEAEIGRSLKPRTIISLDDEGNGQALLKFEQQPLGKTEGNK